MASLSFARRTGLMALAFMLAMAASAAADEKVAVNSLGMRLMRIPAGKFLMGSPKGELEKEADEEAHEVELTRPFLMGECEVTVGQFKAFVKDAKYRTEAEADGKGVRAAASACRCHQTNDARARITRRHRAHRRFV